MSPCLRRVGSDFLIPVTSSSSSDSNYSADSNDVITFHSRVALKMGEAPLKLSDAEWGEMVQRRDRDFVSKRRQANVGSIKMADFLAAPNANAAKSRFVDSACNVGQASPFADNAIVVYRCRLD